MGLQRHRAAAAACACLTVDAAVADSLLQNHCPNSRGFTKRFLTTWYSAIVDYHFVLPFVLTAYEHASTRNKEGMHNF